MRIDGRNISYNYIIMLRSVYNRKILSIDEVNQLSYWFNLPYSVVKSLTELAGLGYKDEYLYKRCPHLDPHMYRKYFSRNGYPWTEFEIKCAKMLYRKGMPVKYIANALHRTNVATSKKV